MFELISKHQWKNIFFKRNETLHQIILLTFAFTLIAFLFLCENDQQTSEHGGQVKEQIQRMLNEIGIASSTFFHYSLSIVQNER